MTGDAVLVIGGITAAFVLAPVVLFPRRSVVGPRQLLTGAGSGAAAAAVWLVVVLVAPPVPPSTGAALAVTGAAALIAGFAGSGRGPGRLLAALLAAATAMGLIFAMVVTLAHWGPDTIVPDVTPQAPEALRIPESRIEMVDPYVLILVLGALAAAALSVVTALNRRRR
ncbi:hypothetical protein Ait01nite_040520 [Actinoplanes italicus]|uniref:Uncharacterized protein n=1 Tax=Actinoplanes italicus TaxID=113567 RepID=A0A2T0K240_9ACTN|nr:hypothetical protein [Actinoplanes italicus]PRX16861.1 hypothetical protein CLV67_118192 [Actinoplanes italicus]GIE31007.1 hypothetical protein Ait01nite_040520 [Actinoplanes italicus]